MSKTPSTVKPAEIARRRRSGKTWAQVREATGTKFNSTRFAKLMATEGYNAAGIKGARVRSRRRSRAPTAGAKPKPPKTQTA